MYKEKPDDQFDDDYYSDRNLALTKGFREGMSRLTQLSRRLTEEAERERLERENGEEKNKNQVDPFRSE